ncbi:MAG: tRNA-dihydrouridine synthase [Candidatus Taylorbacteria bacterium]|nr:tRNA-dihydrouridine synthase [Candidatus Taylorbacteria bacterium]
MVNLGFWKDVKKKTNSEKRPIYVLAPMADVTDVAFRKMINTYGKPDVTWTEFVSADGLIRATPEGKMKLLRDLKFNPDIERPIVAQLFSSHPEYMKQAAALVQELGFDGIDINMGCPDKGIEKQGCGSAMIKNPDVAVAVIKAAKEGAPNLPVTVKTRIGYNKNELETWLPKLLSAEPAVVTIHARTRKEMSKVPARWEHVKRAVEIRDAYFKDKAGDKTLILGNGDALSINDAYEKGMTTGADGVMLGRAIFGNPWLFRNFDTGEIYMPSVEERLSVMMEHTREYVKELGDIKSFAIMKKHYKAYVNHFDGAKELRLELMEKANTLEEVEEIVKRFLKSMR